MNSTQIDTYMNSILSRLTQEEEGAAYGERLTQEEERATDGENVHSTQPSLSLDHWLTQIQSMMNEEASSVSSVSNPTPSLSLLSSWSFIAVLKDDSRDDISLASSEGNNHQARKHTHQLPSPFSGHLTPPSVPSSSSSDDGSTSSGNTYSNSSSHGSHLHPPSSEEDVELDADQIPLGQKALYA
jgi:hypothetical protein